MEEDDMRRAILGREGGVERKEMKKVEVMKT